MQIKLTISTDPNSWGPECDEETAQKAAEKLGEMLADYARGHYPNAEIEVSTNHEEGIAVYNVPDGLDRYDVLADLRAYENAVWVEALDSVWPDIATA